MSLVGPISPRLGHIEADGAWLQRIELAINPCHHAFHPIRI